VVIAAVWPFTVTLSELIFVAEVCEIRHRFEKSVILALPPHPWELEQRFRNGFARVHHHVINALDTGTVCAVLSTERHPVLTCASVS
jgi:hypothetical protein